MLRWQERVRRGMRRMDSVIERRVFQLSIVANQATLNIRDVKQPLYNGHKL